MRDDFYCQTGCDMETCLINPTVSYSKCLGESCAYMRRKHETLKQFHERTGKEWSGAVYYLIPKQANVGWLVESSAKAARMQAHSFLCEPIIVCANTNAGRPESSWRPEGTGHEEEI